MKRFLKSTLALILCLSMIFSGTVIAFAADVAVPTGLTITYASESKISLKWNSIGSSKDYGYAIERATDPNGKWKEIKGKVLETEYDDTDISGGGTYYYRIRGFARAKLFGSWTRTYGDYTAAVKVIVDPGQVKNLMVATIGATSLKLAWDAAKGAAGYQIYMFDPTINDFKKIATTSKNTYTVKKLAESSTYTFKVRAYHKLNGVKYSTFSSEVTASTALYDVKNFRLTSSTANSYSIAWDANDKISGFQLAKYDKTTAEWIITKFGDSLVTKETTFAVTGLQGGGYDKYKIRTVVINNGGYTYGNWSEVLIGGTLPGAPENLEAAANTDNGLSITWDPIEGAAGYEVYCKNENGNFKSVGTTTRNHFNHKNLTEKKVYEYKIRAYVGSESEKYYGNFGSSIKVTYTPIEIPENYYPDDWEETGIIGYLYDPDEKCFYTADDPWQRNFGYNEIYDNAAALVVIIIETARIKFEYDNRDWMVQLWKGQYGWVLYGCEIGIYTKEKNVPVTHYECANDDDMLQMEMVLFEKADSALGGQYWKRTFGRPYERQWWHTGFVLGNMINRYDDDLKMYARITMRDFEMRDAFVEGLKQVNKDSTDEQPFVEIKNPLKDVPDGNNVFWVDKLDVYFYWT